MRRLKSERYKDEVLQAFLSAKAEFDSLVADLQRMSDDHFGAGPDDLDWGAVGSLLNRNKLIRPITDCYFQRGEFAVGGAKPYSVERTVSGRFWASLKWVDDASNSPHFADFAGAEAWARSQGGNTRIRP